MSTFENQIDKVRKYFEEHKAENYPFENALLSEKDEYVKSLYYRMLCTLIRYTGEPEEMQVLYVRRLIAGSNAENEFQDYMKMALDLETKDVEEFLTVVGEDALRYYFTIDGIILLSVVKNADKHYELLAELVEMLGITRKELTYVAAVAKSILAQSTEVFDEAKELLPDSMREVSLYHYVLGFYAGAIVNTSEECHIYASDKEEVDLTKYSPFRARRVVIENVSVAMQENIEFDGCSEVVIRNCKLVGSNCHMEFKRVGKVTVEECEISDFSDRFACFNDTNYIIINANHFTNCGYTGSGDIKGGVLYNVGRTTKGFVLENNVLLNCYIAREEYNYSYLATGVFLNVESYVEYIDVSKNCFSGCECRNNNSKYEQVYIIGSVGNMTQEDNVCTGAITKIYR